MALGNASAGGDFVTRDEWLALVREPQAVVLIARLKDVEPPTTMPATNNVVKPVTVDMMFLTGSRAGEVLRDQRLIGNGQTAPLRKIPVGNDLAVTLGLGKNGATEYIQFNPCDEAGFAVAQKAFKDVEGTKHDNNPYAAAEEAANGGPAATNGLVNSGQASSGPKPWER